MKLCPACGLVLSLDAFPRNRTGACLSCHRTASREAYSRAVSQRGAVAVAVALIAAEDALGQLWQLSCPMCGWEAEARRRATQDPLQIQAGAIHCRRCGSSCWAALISGPATLGAAQAEIERVTGV